MILDATIIAILLAIISGYVEAREQARRIKVNDRRKLPHTALSIARGVLIALASLSLAGFTLTALALAAFMALVFAPVHRVTKNLCSGQRFHYMGPSIRGTGDSWYDGIWWSLTAWWVEVYTTHGKKRVRYHVLHDALPWLACTVFEILLLEGAYLLIQTP